MKSFIAALAILLFAGIAQAQPTQNQFHYGITSTEPTAIGGSLEMRTAYCNSNGRDVGSLFVTTYRTGAGEFAIVGGGSGNWMDEDWTTRHYETAAQAKRAGKESRRAICRLGVQSSVQGSVVCNR
jgi:hypothetical protein